MSMLALHLEVEQNRVPPFCHITQNWRGRPLTDRVVVVELIGATTTETGLKVQCLLDERAYEKGIKVSDAEMAEPSLYSWSLQAGPEIG